MSAAKKSLREQIKAAADSKREGKPVEVEEWDATLYGFELTVREMEQVAGHTGAVQGEDGPKLQAMISTILRLAKDEEGARVFEDDDRDWLYAQPFNLLLELMQRLMRASGMQVPGDEEGDAKNG